MPGLLDFGLRSGLLYLVIVLAIPIQYYLSNRMSVPAAQREASFKRLSGSLYSFYYKYLSAASWQRWCLDVWQNVDGWRQSRTVSLQDEDEELGESPALEVIQHKSPQGYFAGSTEVRSPRPLDVRFRVGQVVRHKIWGYKGVIIGWDPVAHAPEQWLNQMHPPDKWHWRKMPNYSVLVDVKDRPVPQVTYVPQENMEVITGTEISHPDVDSYFDSFDGGQYIMRPALKYLYPHD
ncbi:hypothetical protein BsWGS_28239 [Bradybaena similaris]